MDPNNLLKHYGIGLTGGVATGKTTVAQMIKKRGFPVFDADILSKKVMTPGQQAYDAITKTFGPSFINDDKTLNRKRLRETIFADPQKKKALEAIVHKAIRAQLFDDLEQAGLIDHPRTFFYEGALLVEAGVAHDFKSLWVTSCDPSTQMKRLMARETIDREQAEAYLRNQMPALEKASHGDLVIDTSGDHASVEAQVERALKDLT